MKAKHFAARRLANPKPNPATDPTNQPPPAGAILDLNGLPIPGHGDGSTFQQYSVNFTATLTSTAITFAFREDPAFLSFEDASVTDLTAPGGNLLTNGDFSGGTYTSSGNSATPVGWTYANIYGASYGGEATTCAGGGPQPSGDCWYDGAVQAYDAISQTIPTVVGHTYRISFYLADNSGKATFSRLSTNGDVTDTLGNGIDVTVYALAGLPAAGGGGTPTGPVPSTLLLTMAGLVFVGLFLGYRRFRLAGRNA
ncbi:MAG: hypothetical protein WBL61_08630 [Bryobacteraceae bacterium]